MGAAICRVTLLDWMNLGETCHRWALEYVICAANEEVELSMTANASWRLGLGR